MVSATSQLKKDLHSYANKEKKKLLQKFFKTGIGEYAEGDVFLGVMVPESRIVAKKYPDLPLHDLSTLLHTNIHEQRLVALLILVDTYKKNKG